MGRAAVAEEKRKPSNARASFEIRISAGEQIGDQSAVEFVVASGRSEDDTQVADEDVVAGIVKGPVRGDEDLVSDLSGIVENQFPIWPKRRFCACGETSNRDGFIAVVRDLLVFIHVVGFLRDCSSILGVRLGREDMDLCSAVIRARFSTRFPDERTPCFADYINGDPA